MAAMQTGTRKAEPSFDPRDAPAYTVAEAARYLKLPAATLRSWVVGRSYPKADGVAHFQPLISPPQVQPPLLSFWNLVEAHVLRSLRTEHGVSLDHVREAIRYAEQHLRVERLLLSKQLSTDAGQLFLGRYGKLVNLSASGQLAMRRVFQEHLRRIEWDDLLRPVRLYPFVSSSAETAGKPIAIDPAIAFGRPIIVRRGVSTQAIADRIDAGESPREVAKDYELDIDEIEQAVLYERAA
jgi:uncharacterized protein (DUF433 family)